MKRTESSRVPHPSFFEGWDSTVVSSVGFLADPCSALVHRECTDDPHHPPFSQSARKGWGTRLTMGKPSSPVETPKITLSGAGGAKGKLLVEWENVTASAPFTVK
jgi:hypothetical protein